MRANSKEFADGKAENSFLWRAEAPEGIFENVQPVRAALTAMLQDNFTLRSLTIEGKWPPLLDPSRLQIAKHPTDRYLLECLCAA